jgi:hypothetical protein
MPSARTISMVDKVLAIVAAVIALAALVQIAMLGGS